MRWLGFGILLLLGACGPWGSFDPEVTPSRLVLAPGERGQLLVILRPQGGFSGEVYLGLAGETGGPPPAFVSGGGVVVRVQAPYTVADLFLRLAQEAPPGTYALQVKALAGGLVRYAPFTLEVVSP